MAEALKRICVPIHRGRPQLRSDYHPTTAYVRADIADELKRAERRAQRQCTLADGLNGPRAICPVARIFDGSEGMSGPTTPSPSAVGSRRMTDCPLTNLARWPRQD